MKHTLLSDESQMSTTIERFFCGDDNSDRKIVIPDMQREYCWPTNKLVEGFFDSLFSMAKIYKKRQKENRHMGLLYGYEMPKGHIQLCDGQQRITTIYLLIGVLYKHLNNNGKEKHSSNKANLDDAKKVLISDYEENKDDKEPRLQYAIRESTLSFLRDLVNEYFLTDSAISIDQSDWYFSEYEFDPTVQNMICCVELLSAKVWKKSEELSFELLGYLLKELHFLYFDMKDREHGEEQFVVINTTGKALTITENSKPGFLGKLPQEGGIQKKYSDMWESWEHFFWEGRVNKDDHQFVVDSNFQEFFRWVFIIEKSKKEKPLREKKTAAQEALSEQRTFDLRSLSNNKGDRMNEQEILDCIHSYYKALKIIKENNLYTHLDTLLGKSDVKLSQKECMQFLPVLLFVRNHMNQSLGREVLRVQRFFWSRSEQLSDYMYYVGISIWTIQMMHAFGNTDIIDIAYAPIDLIQIDKALFTAGELQKFELFRLHDKDNQREAYEEAIWNIENLNCCKGHIPFVFDVLQNIGESQLNLISLNSLYRILYVIDETINIKDVNGTGEKHNKNVLFRRALLTLVDYRTYSGWTNSYNMPRYSYAESAEYFLDIFQNKIQENQPIRMAVIKILEGAFQAESISEYLNSLVDNYIKSYKLTNGSLDNIRFALISEKEILQNSLLGRITYGNHGHIYSMSWITAASKVSEFKFDHNEQKWSIIN